MILVTTLNDIANNDVTRPEIQAFYLASLGSSCSHIHIINNPDVINQIVNIIKSNLTQSVSGNEAPCDSSLLFAADVAAEHLSTDPNQYPSSDPPGAYQPICHDGWAIASISRPNVGETDGLTLFHAISGKWVYVAGLGAGQGEYCQLQSNGMPAVIAQQFTSATIDYYDPVSKDFYYSGNGVTPPPSAVPYCSGVSTSSDDINEQLKQAYLQYSQSQGAPITEDQFDIVDLQILDTKYAKGAIQMKLGGGAGFIAEKINNKWQILFDYQAIPPCNDINSKYPDLPKDVLSVCYDTSTDKEVNR